jgi:hypothetical protein
MEEVIPVGYINADYIIKPQGLFINESTKPDFVALIFIKLAYYSVALV